MAFDSDAQSRRAKREQLRQQRLAQQRRLRIRLLIAAAVLGAIALLIYAVRANAPVPVQPVGTTGAAETAPSASRASWDETEPTEAPMEPTTVIHFTAAGDLNVCDEVVNAGGSQFDFTQTFLDVLPLLAEADLTALNFEGNFVGAPYGSSSYSAPESLLTALSDAGVDVIQLANSYSIRNGISGLTATRQAVLNAGLTPVGTFPTNREANSSGGYTMLDVHGIQVAVVAFTKGMDGMGLPEGSEDCVNLLYNDYATSYQNVNQAGITRILRAAEAAQPDITIALVHWGSEYNDVISSTQKTIRDLMLKEGVDVIIGTHPHYVQGIEFDQEKGTFICYSLGDFFGDAKIAGTNYSIVLDLEITRDNETGETRVTNYTYTPIFTVSEGGNYRVVRIQEALTGYNVNYVDRVNKITYDSMVSALDRIVSRLHPDQPEEDED